MDGVFISYGSNVGDRESYINQALGLLGCSAAVVMRGLSSLYETDPDEGVGGGLFLNGAAKLSTGLDPADLLKLLQSIEHQLGRKGKGRRLPRTIDLDLVLYGQRIISRPELKVPHPAMARRPYVLVPMAEIDPGCVHPVLQKTVQALLGELDRISSVRLYRKVVRDQITCGDDDPCLPNQ